MLPQLAANFPPQDYTFVRPDERLLRKFSNARIERTFVGKAMPYARSRTRDPHRAMELSTTPQPLKYKVPIILITDKRMIFLAKPDELLSKKMGTITASHFGRGKSTSFIHLYLSPFWVFPKHSLFSAQLEQEFNQYLSQLVDHSTELRKEHPLKWWGSVLSGGLGLDRTGTPMSDRQEAPPTWTEFDPSAIPGVQKTTFLKQPFLEFKLDRVVASPRASVEPGWEGTAKLFLEQADLERILDLVRNTPAPVQPPATIAATPASMQQPDISLRQVCPGSPSPSSQPAAIAATGGWQRPTDPSSFRWRLGLTWWMLGPAVLALYLLTALAKSVGASWLASIFGFFAGICFIAFFILGMLVQFIKLMRRRK